MNKYQINRFDEVLEREGIGAALDMLNFPKSEIPTEYFNGKRQPIRPFEDRSVKEIINEGDADLLHYKL